MTLSVANFFGVMSILIGFVCLLLSGFLVAVPSPRKQPNLLLAAFLSLTAVELSVWFWGASHGWNSLTAIWFALGKLQMPTFFFFFLSSCYSDVKFKRRDAVHLVPFVLTLVLNWPGVTGPRGLTDLFAPGARSAWLVSQMIYFGYMSAIVALLWRFRKRFRQHYSGGRSEVLIWLTQLAVASLFARTIIITRDLMSLTSATTAVLVLQMFGALLALAITSWIAMKSLMHPQLFRDVDRRLLGLSTAESAPRNADLKRIVDHVEIEKPFLDPELNLASLSDQVAMTPREVSELLNQSLGLHFFDFVNAHRIKHAQMLLAAHPRRSILEILHESGFNSKSSFNTAFKKHAGMTPSAYRAQLRA